MGLLLALPPAWADGSPDAGFADQGVLRADLSAGSSLPGAERDVVAEVLERADGSYRLAGTAVVRAEDGGEVPNAAVFFAEVSPGGVLRSSRVVRSGRGTAESLVFLPGGESVIAGGFQDTEGLFRASLRKFGSDARLLAAYSQPAERARQSFCRQLRVDPAGRLVVACVSGDTADAATFRATLLRLDANLTPDPDFAEAGRSVLPTVPAVEGVIRTSAVTVAPRAEGGYWLGVELCDRDNRCPRYGLARVDAEGRPDERLAPGGLRLSPQQPGAAGGGLFLSASTVDAEGRLYLGGQDFAPAGSGLRSRAFVTRYGADGELDTGFGEGGSVFLSSAEPYEGFEISSIQIQPDGAVLAAGTGQVIRFDAQGRRDTGFSAPEVFTLGGFTRPTIIAGAQLVDQGRRLLVLGGVCGACIEFDGDPGDASQAFVARLNLSPVVRDRTPDPLAFGRRRNAAPGVLVASRVLTVSGISEPVPVRISGPEAVYSVNGARYTAQPGEVRAGDTLRVRLRSSLRAGRAQAAIARLSVGETAASFTVLTVVDDQADPLSFPDREGLVAGEEVVSSVATPTGYTVALPLRLGGDASCTVSVAGGFFETGGTVVPGQSLQLRARSPATAGASAQCSVQLGEGPVSVWRFRSAP
ncbi:MAG TPA: hypothetical protein VFV27_12725 [Nevskiaceae bacterium]|nr:hypothetical protein [Nevskiaceae bacterium]